MKTWMISVVVFLAGCGTLREACPTLSNPEIESLRSAVRADYESGYSYSSEINVVIDICGGSSEAAVCLACLTAVVDDIYGR